MFKNNKYRHRKDVKCSRSTVFKIKIVSYNGNSSLWKQQLRGVILKYLFQNFQNIKKKIFII